MEEAWLKKKNDCVENFIGVALRLKSGGKVSAIPEILL
jgi:hypothetical protein